MLEHCLGMSHIIVAANSIKDMAVGNEVEEIEENIKQDHTLLCDPPKPVVIGILHLIVTLSKEHNTI